MEVSDPNMVPEQPMGMMDVVAGALNQGESKVIDREVPETKEQVKKFIEDWEGRINHSKKFFEKKFDRMRKDQELAYYGAHKDWSESEKYVVNIIQRHVSQKTGTLYAKNPRFVAKVREKMWFEIWDGDVKTIEQAMQSVSPINPQTGLPQQVDPQAVMAMQMLMQDIQKGKQMKGQLDRLAKTLETVMTYFSGEQATNFKGRLKQLVRRTITTAVGYVKLGYQRDMQPRPEIFTALADATERLAHLQQLSADIADGEINPNTAEVEELQKSIEALQAEPELIAREGLTFSFPKSTTIIPDSQMENVNGFIGCHWIVEEYKLSKPQILAVYKKDIGTEFKAQTEVERTNSAIWLPPDHKQDNKGLALVWEVYDKDSGLQFTICEGYPDYLRAPANPDVNLEQFWPYYALTFNDCESEEAIPRSDVQLIEHMQHEMNRSREGLREHRAANRPAYAVAAGQLEDEDKTALQTRPANAIISIKALMPGQDIKTVLQAIVPAPIDPAVYKTDHLLDDILRSVGVQEANLGGTSGGSATEASIAESSRMSTQGSNIDDLDEFLSDISRGSGQILLKEMSPDKVKMIAGPGAVWPQLSIEEIMSEVWLEIEAGSSGKPNKAADLQNWDRIAPYLIQLPEINPQWMARQMLQRLDDKMDLSDAFITGSPSITALNAIHTAGAKQPQPGTGNPATDPNQQGPEGAVKQPRSIQNFGGLNPNQTQASHTQMQGGTGQQ